jgi:hypothetical protein
MKFKLLRHLNAAKIESYLFSLKTPMIIIVFAKTIQFIFYKTDIK